MGRCSAYDVIAFGLRKFKVIACASQKMVWCGFYGSFGEGEPGCDQEHKATSPQSEALRGCMTVSQWNCALTPQRNVPGLCLSLPWLYACHTMNSLTYITNSRGRTQFLISRLNLRLKFWSSKIPYSCLSRLHSTISDTTKPREKPQLLKYCSAIFFILATLHNSLFPM